MPQQYDDISDFPDQEPYKDDTSDFPDQEPYESSDGGGFASGYGLPSFQDIGVGLGKGVVGLGQATLGGLDILNTINPFRVGTYGDYNPVEEAISSGQAGLSSANKYLSGYDSPELKAAQEEFARANGFGESAAAIWRNPGLIGTTAAESAPSIAAGGAIGRGLVTAAEFGPVVAGMVSEGLLGAGGQAAQIREETGDLTPWQAAGAAGSGAVTGAITGASGKVAQKFGLSDIDVLRAGNRSVRGTIGAGLSEGAEEFLQSGQEQASLNLATGKPIGQGVPQAATMGGITGGVSGGAMSMYQPSMPNEATPPAPPSAPPWVDQRQGGGPLVEQLPTDQELPFNDPYQAELPFGAYRGANGRWTNTGPGYQGPQQPGLPEPLQQELPVEPPPAPEQPSLFGEPPAPPAAPTGGVGATNNIDITGPNVIPEGTTLSENQQVVTVIAPTAANVEYWRNKGYVSVPGLRNAQGQIQMARGDVAPLYVTGDRRAPPAQVQPQGRPEVPGPVSEDQIGFTPGQDLEVPNERITPSFIQAIGERGYRLVQTGPAKSVFKFIQNEEGSFDYTEIWENLKRILGRDPTMDELARARGQQPRPPVPPVTPEPIGQHPYQGPPVQQPEGMQPGLPGMGPMPMSTPNMEVPTEGGLDVGGLRQQALFGPEPPNPRAMDPRMEARVDAGYGGPREFDFTGPQPGQMELPWSRGENPQPVDADAAAREEQAAAREAALAQQPIPEQLILDFLGRDADTPEYRQAAQDIGLADQVRAIAKEFLEDERGTLDVSGTIARLRELNARLRIALERRRLDPSSTTTEEVTEIREDIEQLESDTRDRQWVNDRQEILTNNALPAARHMVQFWTEEIRVQNRTGDANTMKHAREMLQLADIRLEELEESVPLTDVSRGPVEVFNPEDGIIIARFRTDDEAIGFIAEHPNGAMLDYDDTSPRPHSAESQAAQLSDRVGQPFEVFDTVTGDSIGTFLNEEQAEAYITGNPDHIGGNLDSRPLNAERTEQFMQSLFEPEDDMFEGQVEPETGQPVLAQHRMSYDEPQQQRLPVDLSHFDTLIAQWTNQSQEHGNRGDWRNADYARQQAELAQQHRYAAEYGDTPPSEPLPDAPMGPHLPNRDELRAATGVPNPPFTFGLQDPSTLRKITRAQEARLRMTRAQKVEEAKEKKARRRELVKQRRQRKEAGFTPSAKTEGSWFTGFGRDQLLATPDGPPGLSIEDKSHGNWLKEYLIVFRGPDGKAVAMAKVNEDPQTGWRTVPTLSGDPHKGFLSAKAATLVGRAIVHLNAAEASGIISEHTAGLIAGVGKLIKDDTGSWEIGRATKELLRFKNALLSGKPLRSVRINTEDDVVNLINQMNGGKTGLPWLASKIKDKVGEFVRDETGAVPPVAPPITPAQKKADEVHWVREVLSIPKNATTMLDLSAPGRQALPLIFTRDFPKALLSMFGALHYDTYKKINDGLMSKDIMKRKIDLNTGKEIPSFGEQIGIKIFSPASEPGLRAEQTASRWLEIGVGNDPLSKIWKHTAGYPIRAGNRGFITLLNVLNVNRTERLLNLARDMSVRGLDTGRTAMPGIMGGVHLQGGQNLGFSRKVSPSEAMDMNPYHNLVLAKEIAEFTNAATGHATAKKGVGGHGWTLENAVSKIGPVLFSPGLLNSRIRMMNPATYVMASPYVRKQYAKAALSTAAAWFIATTMVKMAAGPDAEVNDDITSADFGKVRVGDARLDLGGGFLQFAVAYGRMYQGGATSSSTGQFHRFGSGYQAQTQEDMMERFMVNKLDPVAKFAWDVYSASEYNPMHVGDRTAQMFVPLFIQDLNEISKENPELLPLFGTAAFFGGGTQIYGKGESISKFVDPENDWNVTGGGLRDLMPWNLNNEEGEESTNFPFQQP